MVTELIWMLVTLVVGYGRHIVVKLWVTCIREKCALEQRVEEVSIVLTHSHDEGGYNIW